MKAAIQNRFGSPQVLSITERPKPIIKKSEVLIEVHASSVTQGDRRLRAADFPGFSKVIGRLMFGVFSPRYPTGGTNFSGRVIAIGEKVTRFAVGDDVFGGCEHGAYAEYLSISEDAALSKLPKSLSYEEGASLPYGAGTALVFLRDVAKLKAGEKILIIGAAGGVGRFAVQMARFMGAKVTGVCNRAHITLVKEHGAHEVIDYEKEDYTQMGKSYDVIFDTHSGDGFRGAKGSLSATGRYATVYLNLLVLLQMFLSSFGKGPRALFSVALGSQKITDDIAAWLDKGAFRPTVAKTYPLAQLIEAHQALEGTSPLGDIVVSINTGQHNHPEGMALLAPA